MLCQLCNSQRLTELMSVQVQHDPTTINHVFAEGRGWTFELEDELHTRFTGTAIELAPIVLLQVAFSDGDTYRWGKVRVLLICLPSFLTHLCFFLHLQHLHALLHMPLYVIMHMQHLHALPSHALCACMQYPTMSVRPLCNECASCLATRPQISTVEGVQSQRDNDGTLWVTILCCHLLL